jgi:hypothetical protein
VPTPDGCSVIRTPVLFLDFDGVLHPGSGLGDTRFVHVNALEATLSRLEVRIVISSSWRFHFPLEDILQVLPTGLSQRVVGATGPAHIGRWARFHEIKAWIDRHEPGADWRALDDAVFEFPKSCPQLIACHPQEGFGHRQGLELVRWLARP